MNIHDCEDELIRLVDTVSAKATVDSRYPYTYACDLIRSWAGYNADGAILSRSEAAQIMHSIADIIEIDDLVLAKMLADHYLENEDSIAEQSAKSFLMITLAR